MKFISENKDSLEYEEPNSIKNAIANLFVVSNEVGREFHSVRIIFLARLLAAGIPCHPIQFLFQFFAEVDSFYKLCFSNSIFLEVLSFLFTNLKDEAIQTFIIQDFRNELYAGRE